MPLITVHPIFSLVEKPVVPHRISHTPRFLAAKNPHFPKPRNLHQCSSRTQSWRQIAFKIIRNSPISVAISGSVSGFSGFLRDLKITPPKKWTDPFLGFLRQTKKSGIACWKIPGQQMEKKKNVSPESIEIELTPPPAQDVGALTQAHHICKALRPQDVEKIGQQKMDLLQKPLKFNSSPEKYGNLDWKTNLFRFWGPKGKFSDFNSAAKLQGVQIQRHSDKKATTGLDRM